MCEYVPVWNQNAHVIIKKEKEKTNIFDHTRLWFNFDLLKKFVFVIRTRPL